MSHFFLYLDALWQLILEAAPWLVLGLLIGGLFKSLMPQAFLQRHLTRPGIGSIFKAALMGVPLPLCSCGVIPAAMGLRQAGASKPATTSFLVSTPETGVDSISITYAMMGPVMAVIRPVAALFSAVMTGLLVHFVATETTDPKPIQTSSCCGAEPNAVSAESKPGWFARAARGIAYAFTDLYQSILKWLVIGLLFAAAVQAFVPENWLLQWGDSWVAMLVMLFVGIPMYVCATGSTPIAAGFLMAGISPGAVLVFLLAGPATNMATLGVVQQHMGRRIMWMYLLGIISSALFMGLVVNALIEPMEVVSHTAMQHDMVPFIYQVISAGILLLLALLPLIKRQQVSSKADQVHQDCCD